MIEVVNSVPDLLVRERTICSNCGVTLEYVPSDVRKKQVRDISQTYEIIKHITCPNCDYKIFL